MAVVDDHPDPRHVEQVEAAGRLEEGRRERAQPLPDVVQMGAGGPCRGGGGESVGHVHPGPAAERRRDQVRVQHGHRPRTEAQDDELAFARQLQAEGCTPSTGMAVDPIEAVFALGRGHAEQHDPTGAMAPQPVDQMVVGVEHGRPRAGNGLHHDALHVGQLADRGDSSEAKVVAGDVGHDRDVIAVVAEALAQDAATGNLEDRRVHGRVLEDHLGRLRAAHVALPDQPPVDHDAVGRSHANPPAHQLQDVGHHAHRRRLAVGAGDRDDRDPGRRTGREQRVDDRAGDVLRLALSWVGVHPEPRRSVDLDDRTAGLADRGGDVRADEVDAGDVQTDDLGRGLGDLDVVRMGLHRAIDGRPPSGHVAGQGELDPGARRQHVVEAEALGANQRLGRLVDPDPGQHSLVPDAAARIGVGDVDQLPNGVLAVAGHGGRDPLGDRCDLAADDQAAVVVAGHVGLHDHIAGAAFAQGARIGRPDRLL